jgi:hypothetical protein
MILNSKSNLIRDVGDLHKKLILFGVLLCVFITALVIMSSIKSSNILSGESVEEALTKYLESTGNPVFIEKIREKGTINEDTVLAFNLNVNLSSVSYSIVKKQRDGKWLVEKLDSIPTTKHPGETNPYSYASIVSEDVNGYWGVIFEPNIKTIVLRGEKEEFATVVDLPKGNALWYKVFRKSGEEMTDVVIVKAIDSNGKEVPWSFLD